MDKRIIILILLIVIAIIVAVIMNNLHDDGSSIKVPDVPSQIATDTPPKDEKTVEVTDEMIEKIREDSYLNILLQIQSYDPLYVNYEPLLEAAMRIASEQGLLETNTEGVYLEYVPKNVIHDIIFELVGIKIEKPIVIDDFYYLYDEEGDYYYVVPIGVTWMQLTDIKSMTYSNTDQYIVKCSAKMGSEEMGYTSIYPNVEVKLKYKPNNKYVKYQLLSIQVGKSEDEIMEVAEPVIDYPVLESGNSTEVLEENENI